MRALARAPARRCGRRPRPSSSSVLSIDDRVGRAHASARRRAGRARSAAAAAASPCSSHAAARAHRPVGVEPDLQLGLRPHDGADVAALGDGVALGEERALRLAHRLAHAAWRATSETRASTSGLRSSGSSVMRGARSARPASARRRRGRRPCAAPPARRRGTSRRCRGSGSRARRATSRATVDLPAPAGPSIAITTAAPPGARASAREGRDTRRRSRRARRRARRCARRARRSRRACRCGGRRGRRRGRPRAAPGTPRISQPSSVARTWPPIARSSSATVSRRFGLLHAQLPGAAHDGAAARHRRGEREQRQLVDQRAARSRPRSRSRRARRDAPRRRRSARRRAVVRRLKRLMRAPMRSSTVSRPVRVGFVDMPRTNRRDSASSVAATRNGAADEMSPGTSTAPSSSRSTGHTETVRGPLRDARAGGAQQALGVVARRHRLDHGGRARGRVEPGEQDARLDLRGGDRQLVADRLQLAAAVDVQRRAAVAVAEHGAHQLERHRDAVDRAAADRLVAVERERCPSGRPAGRAAGASACRR